MGQIITPSDIPAESIITNPYSLGLNNLNLKQSPSDEKMASFNFKDPKAVNNLKYIIKDILSGDSQAAKREEFAYLNFEQIKVALEWIMTNNLGEDMEDLLL